MSGESNKTAKYGTGSRHIKATFFTSHLWFDSGARGLTQAATTAAFVTATRHASEYNNTFSRGLQNLILNYTDPIAVPVDTEERLARWLDEIRNSQGRQEISVARHLSARHHLRRYDRHSVSGVISTGRRYTGTVTSLSVEALSSQNANIPLVDQQWALEEEVGMGAASGSVSRARFRFAPTVVLNRPQRS